MESPPGTRVISPGVLVEEHQSIEDSLTDPSLWPKSKRFRASFLTWTMVFSGALSSSLISADGALGTELVLQYWGGGSNPCVANYNSEDCQTASSKAAFAQSVIGTVTGVINIVFVLYAGAMSDRVGRKPFFIYSVFHTTPVFIVFVGVQFCGWDLFWYYSGIVLMKLGDASPVLYAWLADFHTSTNRATAFAVFSAVELIGAIAGILIGGYLPLPLAAAIGLSLHIVSAAACCAVPESLPKAHRFHEVLSIAEPMQALRLLLSKRLFLSLLPTLVISEIVGTGWSQIFFLFCKVEFGKGRQDVTPLSVEYLIMGVLFGAVLFKPLRGFMGLGGILIFSNVMFASSMLLCMMITWLDVWQPMYLVMGINAISSISFPAISALKCDHVPENEYGRVQGGLAGLQSIGGILAPPLYDGIFTIACKPLPWLLLSHPHPELLCFVGASLLLVATRPLISASSSGLFTDVRA